MSGLWGDSAKWEYPDEDPDALDELSKPAGTKKQVVHGSPARKECPRVLPFLWFRKHHWHLYWREVEERSASCFFMPSIRYKQQYEECCWCQDQRETYPAAE